MIFFFKKKPIVLDCYAKQRRVAEVAPIQKTQNFTPEWWKQLSKSPTTDVFPKPPTMRHCVGFINWYTNGVTIPMWCDLALTIGSKQDGGYRYQYADRCSTATQHSARQHNNNYPDREFQHIKLEAPWVIRCEEPVKFMFVEHAWNMIHFKTIRIVPGILDFKYQPSANINLMVSRTDETQQIVIPLLEPLVQILPMSDREIQLNIHSDPEEYEKAYSVFVPSKFSKEYLTVSKIRKRKEEK